MLSFENSINRIEIIFTHILLKEYQSLDKTKEQYTYIKLLKEQGEKEGSIL